MVRKIENEETIVPAFYKSDFFYDENGNVTSEVEYFLRIYILDKLGEKVSNESFSFSWQINHRSNVEES